MAEAMCRLCGHLIDSVDASDRGREVRRAFDGQPAICDPVQALGVPPREIQLLPINGESAALEERLHRR